MLLGILLCGALLIALVLCVVFGAFGSWAWLWAFPLSFVFGVIVMVVQAFLFLCILALAVDKEKQQEEDSVFYRKVICAYIDLVVKVGRIRIRTKGTQKMPKSGRFLLVCNHTHVVDPVVLLSVFKRYPIGFISKREVDEMFLVGKLMRKLLCQPINRENDKEALKTILHCISLIKEDKVSVGVFPEGYILPHRKLHHFRNGVFKIAQKAKVPIVVCTLKNTKYVYGNLVHLRPSDVQVKVLEVIPVEQVVSLSTTELGARIYNEMARDLGPELVEDPLYEEST